MRPDTFLMHNDACENMPPAELLVAALCYLMTQYAREPDAMLGAAIRRHLRLLETHPGCDSRILQNMCQRLYQHWSQLADCQRDGEITTNNALH